jgi:hypothetical protein
MTIKEFYLSTKQDKILCSQPDLKMINKPNQPEDKPSFVSLIVIK